ncbi:DUF262 domain-containing protein [Intrasporangium sp. YIM S08009]|uniref:DUF262 domain-containing protein n=1 Tax=Intrasporangium zincisolvens TaxID=3080018 RepID=UPI002B05C724|nr:DUF262 domain-containing protein [Intrasporangium sp. YIM S08009]
MTGIRIKRQMLPVAELLRMHRQLLLDPEYQREGGIWTKGRQQLFIDSVLNRLDVPSVYLHELSPPRFQGEQAIRFAVVDGRQRLEALVSFASGDFGLAPDFRLLEEELLNEGMLDLDAEFPQANLRFANLRLSDLQGMGSTLYYRFMEYEVPVSIIQTDDQALIEELFFRLNEGVPLTPAEKRARGALLREKVLPLVKEDEIFRAAKFTNRRRSLEDLLLRLLYLMDRGASPESVPDIKKKALDDFASSFRPELGQRWSAGEEQDARTRLEGLVNRVTPAAEAINSTFFENDPLLSSVSTYVVYFLVFRKLLDDGGGMPARDQFEAFTANLMALRGRSEEDLTPDQNEALEFAQPLQGSTTGSYFARRAQIVMRYLDRTLTL